MGSPLLAHSCMCNLAQVTSFWSSHSPSVKQRDWAVGQRTVDGQIAPVPIMLAQGPSKDSCWKGKDSHLGLGLWSSSKFLQSGEGPREGSGNFPRTRSRSSRHCVLISEGDICIVPIL